MISTNDDARSLALGPLLNEKYTSIDQLAKKIKTDLDNWRSKCPDYAKKYLDMAQKNEAGTKNQTLRKIRNTNLNYCEGDDHDIENIRNDPLKGENKKLMIENQKVTDEMQKVMVENNKLMIENQKVMVENDKLMAEMEELQKKIATRYRKISEKKTTSRRFEQINQQINQSICSLDQIKKKTEV